MQLPEGIKPQASAMSEKVVALRLSLSPISHVVYSQNSKRPGHPHQHAKPNEKPLNTLWTIICFVYQAPMHAKRMSKQKSDIT
jgi:hypothetical protein